MPTKRTQPARSTTDAETEAPGRTARDEDDRGGMTVREAGRRGGERVKATRGVAFYAEIGRKGGAKGGPKVRELIERGKQASAAQTDKRPTK